MLNRIKHILIPPVIDDVEKKRIAALLYTILLGATITTLLYSLTIPSTSQDPLRAFTVIGFSLFFFIIPLIFIRFGFVHSAAWFFILVGWGIVNYSAYIFGGIQSPIYPTNIILILIAGLFFGGRIAAIFTGLGILNGVLLVFLETNNRLPFRSEPTTIISTFLGMVTVYILAALLQYLNSHSIRQSMTRTRIEIAERERVEKTLDQSEEHLWDLYENAPVAYFSVRVDGTIRSCNRTAGDLLGYEHADEITSRSIFDLYADTPHGKEKARRTFQKFLTGDQVISEEIQMQKNDGEIIWVSLTANAVRDKDGQLLESRSLVMDITERKQAEEELARQAGELELLHKMRNAIAQNTDLQSMLHTVVEALANTFEYSLASSYLLADDKLLLQHQVGYAKVIDEISIDTGISGRVIREGIPVLVKDVNADPDYLAADKDIVSEICVPLFDGEMVIGMINIESVEIQPLSQIDLDLMIALSEYINIAIERVRFFDDRRRAQEASARQASELELLHKVRTAIAQATDLPGILREAIDALSNTLGFTLASSYAVEKNKIVLQHQVGYPSSFAELDFHKGVIGRAVRTGKPTLVADVDKDPDYKSAMDGIVSEICVPLFDREKVVGAINVESIDETPLTQADVNLLIDLSEYVGVAIERTRLFEERKQAEEALRYHDQFLRAILDATQDATFLITLDGMVLNANKALAASIGFSIADIIGENLYAILPPEIAETRRASNLEVYESGKPGKYMDNRLGRYFENYIYPIETENEEDKWLAIFARDITERVQAEEKVQALHEELEQKVQDRTAQLEAANKELEAFAYSISHDLRAPLRATSGYSSILIEDYSAEFPEEVKRYLNLIRENARQMDHLIIDLLDFSRLSRQQLIKKLVKPNDLIKPIINELKPEWQGRKVEFKVGDLPECAADPILLKQVFTNLISNAVKFTRLQDNAIVEVDSEEIDGKMVYFIRDNGIGFNMQYSDKLFGVFQRLHPANEYEGTGVGLAIVQRILHRHDGQIWAKAEEGKGATFYFNLGD